MGKGLKKLYLYIYVYLIFNIITKKEGFGNSVNNKNAFNIFIAFQ